MSLVAHGSDGDDEDVQDEVELKEAVLKKQKLSGSEGVATKSGTQSPDIVSVPEKQPPEKADNKSAQPAGKTVSKKRKALPSASKLLDSGLPSFLAPILEDAKAAALERADLAVARHSTSHQAEMREQVAAKERVAQQVKKRDERWRAEEEASRAKDEEREKRKERLARKATQSDDKRLAYIEAFSGKEKGMFKWH